MRILVVDDEVEIARLLAEVLELRGHEPFVAHTGAEAVELAERVGPELALIDIWLPDMSGVLLAELLRGVMVPQAIQVFAFSAWHEARLQRAVAPDLLDGYICKPAGIERIERIVDQAVGADA